LSNVGSTNDGLYDLVAANAFGSVTSAVVSLTVLLPNGQKPVIVMAPPLVAGTNLVLGFSLSQGSAASFSLLESEKITGPWTANTTATLATNAQTGGYLFALPAPDAVRFYEVRSL